MTWNRLPSDRVNPTTTQIRKTWDDQASVWYAQREAMFAASRPVHEWLVKNAAPRPGQRLLEIAAGPGDTGFMAAPLLGPTGRLVSSDFAPNMIEAARKRGAELGIENVDYQLLDAQAMDLPDDSFDAAICRWGYMLMPDPAAAFRETRRVLRPGGRLAFAVFTGPADNPWVSMPVAVLREAGHLPPPSNEWTPGILALGDRARLQSLVDGAAFSSSSFESIDMAWTFANREDYWSFLVQMTALGPVFRGISDEAAGKIRAEIDRRVAPFTQDDGKVVLPAKCWGCLAVR